MLARVCSADFRSSLIDLIGNGKANVNFSVNTNGELCLQTSESVILDKKLQATEIKDWDVTDTFTAQIDSTILLLSTQRDKDVEIFITGDILELRQDSFNYSSARVHTEKLQDEAFSNELEQVSYNPAMLSAVILSSKALDDVARTLHETVSSIHVYSEKAYIFYSNARYVTTCKLPDMAITGSASRAMPSVLSRSEINRYSLDHERALLHMHISKTEEMSVPVLGVDMQRITQTEEIIKATKEIATIDMRSCKDAIDVVCKVNRKLIVELGICEDGLSIYVDNSTTRYSVGVSSQPLIRIRISTAQLSCISKLFGDLSDVTVKRGENVLCLEQKNLGKNLLLTGIIY